jgi:hypothetical protein
VRGTGWVDGSQTRQVSPANDSIRETSVIVSRPHNDKPDKPKHTCHRARRKQRARHAQPTGARGRPTIDETDDQQAQHDDQGKPDANHVRSSLACVFVEVEFVCVRHGFDWPVRGEASLGDA